MAELFNISPRPYFEIHILLIAQYQETLSNLVNRTTFSKNITGFEIYQVSSGHKLCSMKLANTKDFLCWFHILLRFQKFKFAVVLAFWGFRFVTSLTGYRKMSALSVRVWILYVNFTAASRNSLTKMEKYSLLTVQ